MSDPQASELRARKQSLRELLLARRRAFDRNELAAASLRLAEALVADPLWRDARGLAAFVGVRGEVDTVPLLERTLAAGKSLWLPRVLGGGRMAFWTCDDLDGLERGRMGLREPAMIGEGVVAPGVACGVDLILVPGLGFSRAGARIGFGAGHYDRALAPWQKLDDDGRPAVVGVCLEAFVEDTIPTATHDLAMDALATDTGVIQTRPTAPRRSPRSDGPGGRRR